MGRDRMVTSFDRELPICPICKRRRIVYLGALACSPKCDAIAREIRAAELARRPNMDTETELDPFELPVD